VYRPTIDVVHDYVREHRLLNGAHELISILKYSGLAEYHAHHDHSPDSRRVVSLVACLGEPDEGGELEFPNFDVKIKLNAGSVILFPSNFPYTHIAHPVISGTKYSMVTWFQ
jgi:predicted 2-oxoglutarate/Fe(II)-dependent dioxygenase YbiX